jgi:heme exporter protein D
VLEILTIADHLFAWLAHHISIVSLIGNIVIPVIIIVYLFADRNVREAFRT